MGKFNFIKTDIEGLILVEPTVFGDSRGYFMETYQKEEFKAGGIDEEFVQDNQSCSSKGVLRGLHFQKEFPQGKLVRVLSGEVFDVAVDLRKGSETYGKWQGFLLSAENKRQLYIPKGFAHGFLVTSEKAEFAYKCTDYYNQADEGGVMYSDPDLNINWNDYFDGEFIISEKDKKHPLLKELPQGGF